MNLRPNVVRWQYPPNWSTDSMPPLSKCQLTQLLSRNWKVDPKILRVMQGIQNSQNSLEKWENNVGDSHFMTLKPTTKLLA